MNNYTDPVCGMEVDPASAAGSSTHEGETIYFCSPMCKKEYDEDPSRFTGERAGEERR